MRIIFCKKKWGRIVFFLILSGCTFAIRTPVTPVRPTVKPHIFRGVFHAHTQYSHDSKASLDFVIKTARQADLDFVVVTDHNNMNGLEPYRQMKAPDRPLLIFGTEFSTWHEGHLTGIGIKQAPPDIEKTQEVVDLFHKEGGYAVISHPLSRRKPWPTWELKDFDGIEVFTFSDIFYADGIALLPKALFFPPKVFLESVLKNRSFPALQLWSDQLNSGRHIAAYGATDAHLKFEWHGLTIENYLLLFQSVTTYALADELKEEKIIEALGHGKSFIAFEVWGLAQDFTFTASQEGENFKMGDTIPVGVPVTFSVSAPKKAEIRLIRDGRVIETKNVSDLKVQTSQRGVYRVEVYENGTIWIISNPIYVE
ncbi:MAG: hypothetical protein A3C35_00420 [Omnitrophica bacterium RIFCSPHIGHO2_02_FULL_46_11]|nr:MAG: hypothetical protein A3A81_08235 [Omnitrophica bacterium RIFCSPLOWO2_01_FULL_45_10b]OGW87165.1 MAG: hypothetical protein A3C35_00420 [Omnitrophica bacterium RIFCSPHIGHO2_02_FULL_46_11]